MAALTPLLKARGLKRHFGGVKAVDGVGLDLGPTGVHALIGPNGAGKSTLVGLLSGRITADAGIIEFAGRDITRLPAHARVRLGIAYTFQVTSIYPRLSVEDNVTLAVRHPSGDVTTAARAALARVGLDIHARQIAGDLSYGHQRLLELAMGLALTPRLLILDEPTQGLAAGEIAGFSALVRDVARDASVLLIEHNMDVVMDLADRITVLDFGRVLASGTPDAIRKDRAVQAAYLGA
ncbi:branched-chain amino acid transport system ATP-binding protein [Amaricoccus macauensis]|uniref:Branched-chain amino acid transport system ATP-binding protein n=1 Tax=Amaricoccus macauensis TaxID=57001 RepID=A0A840SNA8_9RHOB|nr:ABC transporter ATP-binding protein [Amaricoccus macauensis]MBB5220791.1 branched-chain amino acid transport system ATP-binding protein [Amaricoccus macauensis]